MSKFIVVNTDNFGGDYPNEMALGFYNTKGVFYVYRDTQERAKAVADILNAECNERTPRWHSVRPDTYALRPGFEP